MVGLQEFEPWTSATATKRSASGRQAEATGTRIQPPVLPPHTVLRSCLLERSGTGEFGARRFQGADIRRWATRAASVEVLHFLLHFRSLLEARGG